MNYMRKELLGISIVTVILFSLTQANVGTASPEPIVSFDPQPINKLVGSTFDINITVANVTNLYAWQFNVTFNPSVLEFTGIEEGPFLKQAGTTYMLPTIIDNDAGFTFFGVSLWLYPAPPGGANGSGTLATITFAATGNGTSTLHFYESKLNDWDHEHKVPVPIPHTAVDGSATATPIPGDANWDGTVDDSDLSDLNEAYGSKPGDSNWNPKCDFQGDNKVDALDLFDLSKNYGKTV
jgi:hypothetical protein